MADNKVDTLEIEVESSAKSAVSELRSLETELKNVGNTLKNVMGDFKGFGFGNSIEKETKTIEKEKKNICAAAQKMADELIKIYDIAEKQIQEKIHSMIVGIAEELSNMKLDQMGALGNLFSADGGISELKNLLADHRGDMTNSSVVDADISENIVQKICDMESSLQDIRQIGNVADETRFKIDELAGAFNGLESALDQLNFADFDMPDFEGIEEIKVLSRQLEELRKNFSKCGAAGSEFAKETGKTLISAKSTKTVFSGFSTALRTAFSPKTIISGVKSLATALNGILTKTKQLIPVFGKAKTQFSGFNKEMQNGAEKGNALFRSLDFLAEQVKFFVVFEAIAVAMEGVGEAIGVLAKRSSHFNAQISSLMASIRTLGANIAALAVPLVNIFGPALTYIINLVSTAVTYINQFLSALTGKTYTVASVGAYDYAASLDSAADSTKKANDAAKEYQKTVMGFDELNIMSKQSNDSADSGDGSGSSSDDGNLGYDYSEMAINPEILALAEKFKEIVATIFDPMKDAWESKGKFVIESWSNALESVKTLASDIGNTFLDVWTDGTGKVFCENILDLVTDMGDAVNAFATSLDDVWNDNGAGKKYIESIFDEMNAILNLVHVVGSDWNKVWSNGTGKEIFGDIFKILTNVNESITNIADSFRSAWEINERGKGIIQNILDIVNLLLDSVAQVSIEFNNWTLATGAPEILSGLNEALESIKTGNWNNVGQVIGNAITAVFEDIDRFVTWDKVQSVFTEIPGKIAEFLNGSIGTINWHTVGKTFADGLNLIINAGYTFVTTFDFAKFGASIGQGLTGIFETLEWENIGKTISTAIKGLLETAINILLNTDFTALGAGIGEAICSIEWGNILLDVAGLIALGAGAITETVVSIFVEIGKQCGTGLYNGIKGIIDTVSTWIDTNIIKPIKQAFTDLKESISEKWKDITSSWKDVTAELKMKANEKISDIKQWWKDRADQWKEKASGLKMKAETAANTVKSWFSDRSKQWKDKTNSLKLKAGTTASTVKSWFSDRSKQWKDKKVSFSIKVSATAASIKQSFKSAINSIIGWINTYIIDPLNKITIKIPKIVAFGKTIYAGKTFGFNLKRIQTFATGGFPEEGPFFMNRGEIAGKFGNGRSVVANNQQITEGIAKAVAPAVYTGFMSAFDAIQNTFDLSGLFDNLEGNLSSTISLAVDTLKTTFEGAAEASQYMAQNGSIAVPTPLESYSDKMYQNNANSGSKSDTNGSYDTTPDGLISSIKTAVAEAMIEHEMLTGGQKQSQDNGKSQAPTLEFTLMCDSETMYRLVKKGRESYNERYNVTAII